MASHRRRRLGCWSSACRAGFRWLNGTASLLAGPLRGSAAPTPDTTSPGCGFCGWCSSFRTGMPPSCAAGRRTPGHCALRSEVPSQADNSIIEIIIDIHINAPPLSSSECSPRSAGVPEGFAASTTARSAASAESAGPSGTAGLSAGGFCGASDVRGSAPGALRNGGLSGCAVTLSGLTGRAFSYLIGRTLAGLVRGVFTGSVRWILRRTSCRLAFG